jgi:hypothetical protein
VTLPIFSGKTVTAVESRATGTFAEPARAPGRLTGQARPRTVTVTANASKPQAERPPPASEPHWQGRELDRTGRPGPAAAELSVKMVGQTCVVIIMMPANS